MHGSERVTDETRAAERREAHVGAGAREVPTPHEEAAADRYGRASDAMREHYLDMVERGARQAGEGRLP